MVAFELYKTMGPPSFNMGRRGEEGVAGCSFRNSENTKKKRKNKVKSRFLMNKGWYLSHSISSTYSFHCLFGLASVGLFLSDTRIFTLSSPPRWSYNSVTCYRNVTQEELLLKIHQQDCCIFTSLLFLFL